MLLLRSAHIVLRSGKSVKPDFAWSARTGSPVAGH
jgi:hypothetical protein